jgi:hypothetical protein
MTRLRSQNFAGLLSAVSVQPAGRQSLLTLLTPLSRLPASLARTAMLLGTASIPALLLSACAEAPPPLPTAGAGQVTPVYAEEGRLQQLQQDTNGDGRIDTWVHMDGARAVRSEVDENGDGRIDRWEFYVPADVPSAGSRTAAPAALVVLDRVERATRHDGRVSRWEFYESGQFARVEEDTNGDGKVDKWETYKNGGLVSVSLDTRGRGWPDRRLVYGTGGVLERIEEDPDGSGRFRPLSQVQ